MKYSRPRTALIAILAALVLTGCGPTVQLDEAAPELRGTDLDGTYRDITELEGSVVVVAVWASWCGPCREEVSVLSNAQERLGPEGLMVLGLNFQDNPNSAREFVAEEQASFPSVVDRDGTISVGWGVTGIPQSFLVDRDGKIVARHFGAVTEEWIEDVVAPEVRR